MTPLTGKVYDYLKFVTMVVLPAAATLYLGLGQIWDWPATEQVGTSIVLVTTFLGVVLQINSRSYYNNDANYDGFLSSHSVDPDTGIPDLQMTITKDPSDILAGNVVRLKVGDAPSKAA